MATTRRLPNSNPTRLLALNSAKAKLDADPATPVITATRLAAMEGIWNFLTLIRDTSQVIFTAEPDKFNLFKYR